jgi:futalosine hydrolase
VRLLIVTATDAELQPLVPGLQRLSTGRAPHVRTCVVAGRPVDVLTTGVGMVATAAWCARTLGMGTYDMALNLGLCGTFDPAFPPGTVAHVVTDRMPELGAEDRDAFLTVHELQLLGEDEFPFRGGRLVNDAPPAIPALTALPPANGITVNTVHGGAASIGRIAERVQPQVESMEGAAFMYACLTAGVPFAQVRAVSNVVEPRNRQAWRVAEAIAVLAEAARRIVEQV